MGGGSCGQGIVEINLGVQVSLLQDFSDLMFYS